MKSLRASLAGKPATLARLAETDFARVALTKADAATARTPRTMAVMLKTLSGLGDPKLMFTTEIAVEIPAEK